jgi:AcrR family transcriptional regulator
MIATTVARVSTVPVPDTGGSLRERLVDAAVALTTEQGWAHVTMARLADVVGVSRQTVYNEIGTKPRLAEAMILRELERFLGVVNVAFDAHPTDLVGAIRAACQAVLETSQDNPLLHAVVSATHGADTELLPLLTTHADSLLVTAKAVIAARVAPYDIELPPAQLDPAIDMVVRVVLSHVMQPSATPARTADDLAWIADRVLRPTSRR